MAGAAGPLAAMQFSGSLIQAYSQWQSNLDQARVYKQNEQEYYAQEAMQAKAFARESKLLERQKQEQAGKNIGFFAKVGISLSGSALLAMSENQEKYREETLAREESNRYNLNLIRLKGQQSGEMGSKLSSFKYNALQSAGTLLGGAGSSAGTYASLDKGK